MRRIRWNRFSLATKLSLVMASMIVVSMLGVTLLSIRRTQRNLQEELERNAELVLDTLQAEAAHSNQLLNVVTLAGMIEVMAQDQHILNSGRIYDQEGHILVDAFDPQAAPSNEIDPLGLELNESEQTVFIWTEDQLLAGRAIVLQDQHLGAMSVSLPLARFRAEVKSVRDEGLTVALLTLAAGILIALLLSRSITRPLQESVRATERIAKGNLMQRIAVSDGSDEIAVLSDAMEHMRAEMQGLYASLENKVIQRTRELRESDERFRRVIASISDVVYVAEITQDHQWVNQFLSPTLESLTGYPLERFTEDTQFWPSLIHASDQGIYVSHLQQFGQGRPSETEYRLINASGSVIWVRDSGQVEEADDRSQVVIYGVISNITDRQNAIAERERLLESEREQRLLAETLTKVTLALTSQTSLELLLDEFLRQVKRIVPYSVARISLLQADKLQLVRWRRYEPELGPQHTRGPSQPLAELPLEAQVFASRQPLVIPDTSDDPNWIVSTGREWVRSYLAVPICQHDRVLGLLQLDGSSINEFSTDDGRRLQPLANAAAIAIENAHLVAELEGIVAERTADVQNEQERNATILRNVNDAIMMTGLDMRVQYVNQAFTELTGYSTEDVFGKPIDKAGIPMEELDGLQAQPDRLWQSEVIVRRKDGTSYDAALTMAPMFSIDGRQLGYVSNHRDISHAKALERVRGRFMTNVSHQLRTPVTNIKLYVDLLRRNGAVDKREKYMKTLLQQTDRLEHLVQDILEMTSLDSRPVARLRQKVLVRDVIQAILTRYEERAKAADLILTAGSEAAPCLAIQGDQAWLARALCELMDNALAFTPPGGTVYIDTKSFIRQSGHWACITVGDTGPGISTDEREKIFDRFYRGSVAEAGHIPGTGLGLSIVAEITRAHGGRVTLESEQNQGSRFTIWLPVV